MKNKLNLKKDLWINLLLILKKNTIERLSGLAILSIEKEMLEELKYKNLISNFASQKARKIDFKYKKKFIYIYIYYFINI